MAHILIVGASGLVGSAAVRRFAVEPSWQVTAVSRRRPRTLPPGVRHLALDLAKDESSFAIGELRDVTHLIYTAVAEDPAALSAGWRDADRMQLNLTMLRNALDPVVATCPDFRHLTLMQGMKAYGVQVDPNPPAIPLRENRSRHPHENFYWLQEDHVRAAQEGKAWHWTIFRPPMIVGDAPGSNLNVLLALAAYAAIQARRGMPFVYPGHGRPDFAGADVDLLAEALLWATSASAAENETFNIDNGEVFGWRDLWPILARECGVSTSGPTSGPASVSIVEAVADAGTVWAELCARHRLAAPTDLHTFLGSSFELADLCLGSVPFEVPHGLMSSVKLRNAGFTRCVDSEEMG